MTILLIQGANFLDCPQFVRIRVIRLIRVMAGLTAFKIKNTRKLACRENFSIFIVC